MLIKGGYVELNHCKFRYKFKQILIYTIFFVFFLGSCGIKPIGIDTVKADSSSFEIRTNIDGNMVPIKSYSASEMKSLNQVSQVYSSIDYVPNPNIILGKGILLRDLLADANINLSDVQSLKLYSTDGWSHTYSMSYLFGTQRSYYPNIVTKWNKKAAKLPAFLSGSEKNKRAVEPMFALQSYQERFGSEKNWDKLNRDQGTWFFFGQTSISEKTYVNFGKYINKMDITLKNKTPLINVSTPETGKKYSPGESINLSGTAKNLTGVTFQVNNPEGKTIINSTKLEINNDSFATNFKLPSNAVEGEYTIILQAKALKSYTKKFNFKVSKDDSKDNNNGKGDSGDDSNTSNNGNKGLPADTLTIKVGYYGGPYYVKKVYKVKDLEALPQVSQTYTFIDNMPSVVVDSATGVKLTDILSNAGIDLNSIEEFHFYCTDVKVGWYQSLPKSYLLDTTRYYYPNLPDHWDRDSESASAGATKDAVKVDTMIALEDNWKRFGTGPDFTNMQTDTRFRLVFGQTDTSTHNASRSAKWIHSIEVMLGGMAPTGVKLNQNIANIKVGSTFSLKANVSGDKSADKRVTWSSSNENVAKVDSNGQVKIVGKGTASITVTTKVGGKTAVCVINASNKSEGKSLAGTGSKKNGSKDGKKDGSKENNKNGSKEPGLNRLASKSTGGGVAEEVSENQLESGSQPWRVVEMSEDAAPLQLKKEDNSSSIYVGGVFVLLLLVGSIKKYTEYIKEVVN